jgi:SAM-dependent methyltransferase
MTASTPESAPLHEHYDHYSVDKIKRLRGLYGRVEEQMNRDILAQVQGQDVLDVGCGFGSLVDFLSRSGMRAKGVDTLASWVEAGREAFPNADLRVNEPYAFGFRDKAFDTVILKEALHHIADESDVTRFFDEIKRVCRKRLIVVDPNPTWLLITLRRLIGHVDPVCGPEDAREILARAGFRVRLLRFSETVALPLSGGYIGPVLLPNWQWLQRLVFPVDRAAANLLRFLELDRALCWRYMLVADLD